MIEALTTEALLSLALVAASLLAVGGTMAGLRATRPAHIDVDVDAAVGAAPYGRLHNIVPPDRG